MKPNEIKHTTEYLAQQLESIKHEILQLGTATAEQINNLSVQHITATGGGDFVVNALNVLVLSAFVGYYVIWNVTPALYAPLMAISNAIASVMIVGAMIAAGTAGSEFAAWMGFFAVLFASINFFGGWVISDRMLAMFKKKKKEAK
jgi:NAD(P) transhydrogenase subunit alpha